MGAHSAPAPGPRAPDCFFQLGNLSFAEADYQQALALSPQDEGANLRMGLLQEKMGFCEQRSRCAGRGRGRRGSMGRVVGGAGPARFVGGAGGAVGGSVGGAGGGSGRGCGGLWPGLKPPSGIHRSRCLCSPSYVS